MTDDTFEFRIACGWAAPTIEDQLKAFKIEDVDEKKLSRWQRAIESISFLSIHDVLTNGQRNTALNRLRKNMEADLVESGHLVAVTESRDE